MYIACRFKWIWVSVIFFSWFMSSTMAQTAPTVTNIRATQHDGQTFITWTDPAPGSSGKIYRYDLYRSTSGAIKELTHATLVQKGLFNNSGQLIGPKPFNQTTRLNDVLPMARTDNHSAPLPLWSGLAVYTNRERAAAYYAVITQDTTGAQRPSAIPTANSLTNPVEEFPSPIAPVLQI